MSEKPLPCMTAEQKLSPFALTVGHLKERMWEGRAEY